jgi:6-phosphofructokinase
MHTQRIGALTSGGDCPGLNAVLRGVTKAAEKLGWQVVGFEDGFEGLLPPAKYIVLDQSKTAGIMQVLGHLQRGGAPTTLDRLLETRFGVTAVQLIAERKFGSMVSYRNDQTLAVPIADAVRRLRFVDPNDQMVKTAREIGISFGD